MRSRSLCRRLVGTVSVVVVFVVLTACGSSDTAGGGAVAPTGGQEGGAGTATAPAGGGQEGGAGTATAPSGAVDVNLTEFAIDMPNSIPAGATTFNVANTGAAPHNFEIEGQGIERKFDNNLNPGESNTLQLDLQPGTYRVYCPVGSHAERGMQLELTVTE